MNIKEILLEQCKIVVNTRLQNIQDTMASNQKALQSETKSSAGDKHETGRAMLQLEMEKAGQQLASIQQMKATLAKVELTKESKTVHLGSVIETNVSNYFLAISAGELKVLKKKYFAVSVASPIGKLLLGKQENESFVFHGKTVKIAAVF